MQRENTKTFLLRDATPQDMGDVLSVVNDAYREYGPTVAADAAEGHAIDAANVVKSPAEIDLIVAVRDDELVGSVSFYRDGSHYAPEWPVEWPAIRLLAVRPRARGAGIGRALTLECVTRARLAGARKVGLHTTSFMNVARGMYERIGFRRAPALDVEYAPGLSVLAYLLDLEKGDEGA